MTQQLNSKTYQIEELHKYIKNIDTKAKLESKNNSIPVSNSFPTSFLRISVEHINELNNILLTFFKSEKCKNLRIDIHKNIISIEKNINLLIDSKLKQNLMTDFSALPYLLKEIFDICKKIETCL
jgi:hypothetical protein